MIAFDLGRRKPASIGTLLEVALVDTPITDGIWGYRLRRIPSGSTGKIAQTNIGIEHVRIFESMWRTSAHQSASGPCPTR